MIRWPWTEAAFHESGRDMSGGPATEIEVPVEWAVALCVSLAMQPHVQYRIGPENAVGEPVMWCRQNSSPLKHFPN
jgi:hypothetical protein